jgi:hypothetical protein
MKPPEANDPLDKLLREDDAYVADGGFTARVITALPRKRRAWLRPAILLCASLVGVVLMVLFLPSFANLIAVTPNGSLTFNRSTQNYFALGVLLLAAGSLVWTVFAVVKQED